MMYRFLGSLLGVVLLVGCGDDTKTADKGAEAAGQEKIVANSPPKSHAQALHDQNCISCHDSGMYTKADRKVKDFPQLLAQVQRCDANLGTRLFDEDVNQITDYLNQAYYKFPK